MFQTELLLQKELLKQGGRQTGLSYNLSFVEISKITKIRGGDK